jgi:hypothetical protein
MHQALRHKAIDRAGNLDGQNASNRLSVVGHHELITAGDGGDVPAQMVAKISNADFHAPPMWLHNCAKL